MINFMTNNLYKNDNSDIKLFIVTNKNIPLISTKNSDGTKMKEIYKLDYYNDNYTCKYHIDYLQVLLNKYFKNTPLNKYIANTNNDISEEIIKELVKENNIVLSNTTLYDNISYQINNIKSGKLYINKDVKKEQIETLLIHKDLFLMFNYIEIIVYKDNKTYKTIDLNIPQIKHNKTKKLI